MASTTSTSAICRRRSWIVTSRPPRRSAAWRSGARSPRCRATPFCLPADLTQEDQLPGLPIGTRGGMSTSYTFAQDGEYEIQILLARDLAGIVSGLREDRPHELLVLLDREPVADLHGPEASQRRRHAARQGFESAHCREVQARTTSRVTFVKDGSSLIDTPRQPTESRFNDRRHPRTAPAIEPGFGDRALCAKRRRGHTEPPPIVCLPANRTQTKQQEEKCAGTILSTLMRRAYRRPIAKADVDGPMAFYREGARRRRFRRRNRNGAECCAHQPGVPVPRGKRPARK